jgi:hypothetical protein
MVTGQNRVVFCPFLFRGLITKGWICKFEVNVRVLGIRQKKMGRVILAIKDEGLAVAAFLSI